MPRRAAVQAGGDYCVGRVVPNDAVALVGHEKGHAHRFTGRRIIVVFAIDGAAPIVQNSFLVLSESVVVLIGGRRKKKPPPRKIFLLFPLRRRLPHPPSPDWGFSRRAGGWGESRERGGDRKLRHEPPPRP